MSAGLDRLLLLFAFAWPLLLALALAVPASRAAALRLVPAAAAPALLVAIWPGLQGSLTLPWLLLGSGLLVDELSRVFLLVSAILWTVGGLVLPAAGRQRFAAWYLVTMAGNFGVLLAADVPFFFLAYAAMSLASCGLVIHAATPAARRALMVYLVFVVLGEVLLLTAFLLIVHDTGAITIEDAAYRVPGTALVLLLLTGFGIKAGVPLLHLALPPVYAVTPLAAVVPLAGALLHLGLYGWMRFLPAGVSALPEWSAVFAAVGSIGFVFGVAVGLTQRDPRALLAYSSISQTGLMTLAVGIGLAAPADWPLVQAVLLMFVLHHALAKGALFYGLGIAGRARLGLWLPALALAGLPFTGGALVKAGLKDEVHRLPGPWGDLAAWILLLSAVGSTLLMARFLYLALREDSPPEVTGRAGWWPLLAAVVLLPWVWPLELARVSPLWGALWPMLLAAVPAWLVYRGAFALVIARLSAVPPGDFLVLIECWLRRLPRPHAGHGSHVQQAQPALGYGAARILTGLPERWLGRWGVAVVLLLVLIVGLYALAG